MNAYPPVCDLLSQTLPPHFLFPAFAWGQKMIDVQWLPKKQNEENVCNIQVTRDVL